MGRSGRSPTAGSALAPSGLKNKASIRAPVLTAVVSIGQGSEQSETSHTLNSAGNKDISCLATCRIVVFLFWKMRNAYLINSGRTSSKQP